METITLSAPKHIWNSISNLIRSLWITLKLMTYNKVGFLGFLLVVALILFSTVGPYFVKLDTTVKVDQIYMTPSAQHWLGTDHQGRDVFSQIVHGGYEVLEVGLTAATIAVVIAVTFGVLAAFVGSWVDDTILAITDFIIAVPQFAFLTVLAAIIHINSMLLLAAILGLLNWPALLRTIRAQALSLKEREFVEAARALDLGTPHIIFREIVPNMMSYIVISFSLATTYAIYQQVGLILLGLVPFSGNNWGVMLSKAWVRGAIFYKGSFWYIMSPVIAIALLQLAIVTTNRSIEQVYNPRLRTDM